MLSYVRGTVMFMEPHFEEARVHNCLSIPAAAELCGVGEPAIRRAFREGRIKPACFWHVGGSNVGTYLNFESALLAYGVDRDKVHHIVREWVAQAAIVRTPDGEEWVILDQCPPVMFPEGSASADWVIDHKKDEAE